jgi:periodic tryptophan protein 1
VFVHHDIPLPAFPLCLAHGQVSQGGTTGNFCAVGTFNPGIEIWNLDVLNALEPSCILGGEDTSAADELMRLQIMNAAAKGGGGAATDERAKYHSANTGRLRPGSHTDAVIALSWNQIHKQVIASGSADTTVKLWDVTRAGDDNCNAATFLHHKDKVQAVAWNPNEGTLLASGSFDKTVALLDARSDGGASSVRSVRIKADCEALAWDPFRTENLTVIDEDGTMTCWDVRKFETATPLWQYVASEYGGVTNFSYNSHVPGLVATSSVDKTVTLWDFHDLESKGKNGSTFPRLCGSKDMRAGKLYSVSFYPSSPWLLGTGGSGNQLSLWDLSSEEPIQNRFSQRLVSKQEINQTTDASRDTKEHEEALVAMMADRPSQPDSNVVESDSKKKNGIKKKRKQKVHRKTR